MLRKKKLEVKLVKDQGQEFWSPTRPIEFEQLSKEIAQDVVAAYVVIKVFKTFCSVLEHVVVTRIK